MSLSDHISSMLIPQYMISCTLYSFTVCLFLEWRGEGWVGSGKFKEGYAHNLRQL